MANEKFQLTTKWAIAGAVAGLGFAGLNQAIGQARLVPKPPTVDGWKVTGDYESQSWPQMTFTVTITNTLGESRDLKASVELVRQVFKGNPVSRAFRPSDIETTDLENQTLTGRVSGSGSKTFTVSFKTQPNSDATKPLTRTSYLAMVDFDGKRLYAAAGRPKVAQGR